MAQNSEGSFKQRLFRYFQPVGRVEGFNPDFTSLDLGSSLNSMPGSREFYYLNRFSSDDLKAIMSEVGLVRHLEKKGFGELHIQIDIDEAMVHYLKLYNGEIKPGNLLLDLRLTETKFRPAEEFFSERIGALTFDMIVIEWLSAQNPKGEFSDDKPQLPGQKKPGLGILNYCFEMMYVVAREITRDGFMDVPDHMHGAVMYSRKFKFFNPAHEAVLRAIIRDLSDFHLLDISWGMITDTVIDKDKGKPQVYDPSEQIFSVSDRMHKYFQSRKYRNRFNEVYKKKHYYLDYDEMVKRRDKILKKKNIVEL